MGMRMYLHLNTTTKIWQFRKRVSTELVNAYCAYTGKKTPIYKTSLQTKDRKQAELLVVTAEAQFNILMQTLRYNMNVNPDDLRRASLSLRYGGLVKSSKVRIDLDLIQTLRSSLDAEMLEVKSRIALSGTEELVKSIYRRKEMRQGDYYKYLQNASRIVYVYEKMFLEPALDVSKELAETRRYIEQSQLDITDRILHGLVHQNKPENSNFSEETLLSAALEQWKILRHPQKRTILEWELAVRRFIELHGDLPVEQIKKEHIRKFKNALVVIPTALASDKKNLKLPELLKLAEQGKLKGNQRSPSATNKLIGAISSILDVMKVDGIIEVNPAIGMRVKEKGSSNRLPYNIDDLTMLFHSELYKDTFNTQDKRPSRFWLPLLALYTGARANELAQAQVSDIIKQENFWYISINIIDEGKSLKTASSKRNIPIHHELVKCGFIQYVEKLKKAGAIRLFEDLKLSTHGGYAGSFSKWYGRYCNDIGLDNPNKVFHSFRHTFKDAGRDSDLLKDVNDALTGHSSKDVGDRYGLGYRLEKLNDALQKIVYKGLDISHLYVSITKI